MNKIIYILLIMLCTSCALTYETQKPKCELMQRGEPCLTNHACCNVTYNNHNLNYYGSWWYWNKPVKYHTNYVIVKPNNKPNHRPNKPNKPRPNNRSKRK